MLSTTQLLNNLLAKDRKVSLERLGEMATRSYTRLESYDRDRFIKDLLNLSLEEQSYVLEQQQIKDQQSMYEFGILNLKTSLEHRKNQLEYKTNPTFQTLYTKVYHMWFSRLPSHQQEEILHPNAPEIKYETDNGPSGQDWEDLPSTIARNNFNELKTKSFSKLPVDEEDAWYRQHAHAEYINKLLTLDAKQQREVILAQAQLSDGKDNLNKLILELNYRLLSKAYSKPSQEFLDFVKTTLENLQTFIMNKTTKPGM